jgi:3-(3-hydroxy-phenyl)propionate hydroxylase
MVGSKDTADVVIVGAGPVGLTLANILGLQGVRTLVVDERPSVIDYPRGVGLDDEALRTFQSIGLVDHVLPHTVPNQILRFFDAKRRLLAEMAPPDARFGWPKRNGFVQPMVDAELLVGLDRFDHVEVAWNRQMENCIETDATDENDEAVTVEFADGHQPVRARYVVGCDGGRSVTRRLMGVSFDGTTSSTRWLVIDTANDPLGHPNSEVCASPARSA